jgi:hypothetical protein
MTSSNPVRYTKHFLSLSNSDAVSGGVPTNFAVQFNNNSITNTQSTDVKTHLTPIAFSCNWTYYNISTRLGNNQFKVSSAGFSSVFVVNIPDGIYNAASLADAITLAMNTSNAGGKMAWSNGTLITWTVSFLANSSQIKFLYVNEAGTAPSGSPSITISVAYINGTAISMVKELGFASAGTLTVTYASKTATPPYTIDLVAYEVIRIHSNVAKSFFTKRNGVLTQNDVLFEIPVNNTGIGSTLYWSPATPDSLRQEIVSNIDFMTIRITDKYDNEIQLDPSAEVCFSFAIEREVMLPDQEDRLKASMQYLQFNRGA